MTVTFPSIPLEEVFTTPRVNMESVRAHTGTLSHTDRRSDCFWMLGVPLQVLHFYDSWPQLAKHLSDTSHAEKTTNECT